MAWGYAPDDENPDYSGFHDFSEDEPDYADMSDDNLEAHRENFYDREALEQDILPGDYKRENFKDNFRDKYREALSGAERVLLALCEHITLLQNHCNNYNNIFYSYLRFTLCEV